MQEQLQSEIAYNESNLNQETIQKYKRRVNLEVCHADGLPGRSLFSSDPQKCIIRVKYRGLQRKTKKNLNCKNPKFYEIFSFPVANV